MNTDKETVRRTCLLVILLLSIAAVPRLYHLGQLSFYGDEETNSFPARSLAEGKGPLMPSGMPYYRSLPFTWLNALSAKTFGLDNEWAYRLPSAVFGILTVPLLFIAARPFVGTSVAFLAALLLAFSEWHIVLSRYARMYVPFLFFYISTVCSILLWAKKNERKWLIVSAVLLAITATLHKLSILTALIPLIALFVKDFSRVPQYRLIAFSVIGGIACYAYGKFFVDAPFRAWSAVNRMSDVAVTDGKAGLVALLTTHGLLSWQAVSGALLGLWLGRRCAFPDNENGKALRWLARYGLAGAFAVACSIGHLHAAFLAMVLLLLLRPGTLFEFVRRTYQPLILILLLGLLTAVLKLNELGLVAGLKALLSFPYPNWITLNALSTGVAVFFIACMLYWAIKQRDAADKDVTVLLLVALLPLIFVGVVMKWAPPRYWLQAYPFILMVAAYALYAFVHKLYLLRWARAGIYTSLTVGLVILSGVLGGHGLLSAYRVATLQHGDRLSAMSFIYPDHQSLGRYVAAHKSPEDIVVAQDVLQQFWYVGECDYWLRDYRNSGSERMYMYQAEEGKLYDIYVASKIATAEALQAFADEKKRRIWVITSGEEEKGDRQLFMSSEQLQWLESIEKTYTPVFVGRDGVSHVYCLNGE